LLDSSTTDDLGVKKTKNWNLDRSSLAPNAIGVS
jgi:hypothetical protein